MPKTLKKNSLAEILSRNYTGDAQGVSHDLQESQEAVVMLLEESPESGIRNQESVKGDEQELATRNPQPDTDEKLSPAELKE